MKNWSVDEQYLRKHPGQHPLWRLEQMITYGLDKGETIDKKELLKHWPKLAPRLSPGRRNLLKFLLWA